MIFQHTLDKVLDGSKTQTSRIVKLEGGHFDHDERGNKLFDEIYLPIPCTQQVGKTYAVQSGRGQKAVARIEITGISQWDVRTCTQADAEKEGFTCPEDFWLVWMAMHDKPAFHDYLGEYEWLSKRYWPMTEPIPEVTAAAFAAIRRLLPGGTAERYDAWKLTFKLV